MAVASITNTQGPLQSWLVSTFDEAAPATAEEREQVHRSLRDCVGVALAGASQRSVAWALDHVRRTGAPGPAAVWGTRLRLDRASAAMVNGTAVQALEFDDIAPALAAHLSSVVVPTLTSFGDELDAGRLVDGTVLGLRTAAAVAPLIGFDAHSRGLQPTHIVGPLAAAMAAGHALGMGPDQLATALGLAVTGPIGLRANTGTRAKALQSGLAAASAVRAIELARTGPDMAAGASAVDSSLALFGAGDDAVAEVVGAPLPPPAYLAIKPYPTSGAAHSSIEALLDVRSRVPSGTVPDRLEVRVPCRVPAAMGFVRPRIADEARWSLRYALATAWERGDVDLGDFEDDVVARARDARDPGWLEIVPDPTFAPRGEQAEVTLWAGTRVERASVGQRLGYPGRPLGVERVRAKFDRCLDAARLGDAADALWDGLARDPSVALSQPVG